MIFLGEFWVFVFELVNWLGAAAGKNVGKEEKLSEKISPRDSINTANKNTISTSE